MAKRTDPLGVRAHHHVDDVPDAKPLARAHDGRQHHLGLPRGFGARHLTRADVARAAVGLPVGLAKVAEQLPPPAHMVAGVGHHIAQAPQGAPLLLLVLHLVDEEAQLRDVAVAEQQQAGGRIPVAPAPPRLLVVAFDVLGQIAVDHEAHVGFVDAHAEGDGGHHHVHLIAVERLLVGRAHVVLQARVVGQGLDPAGRQVGRRLLHAGPGGAVDDARFARML